MSIVVKLSKIEDGLKKMPTLYLSGNKSEFCFEKYTLEQFILSFLTEFCETLTTYNAEGILETKQKKRRSISDIYRLARHYYTNVSLLEVQYILAQLWKKKRVGFFFCNENKKRVYMSLEFYKTHTHNPIHYPNPDEYGITPQEIKELSEKDYDSL